ncbi:MAG TPA: MFS transporter [Planctomycetes bacterium]|nr:MFS transporter [Planctomycetaceae bacterium]HIM28877.1 MFS transporter [Planctomycetota bacterium]
MTKPQSHDPLSKSACYLILLVAFLGWGFAGCHMAITSIVMRVAVADLLPAGSSEGDIGEWFGWLVCAFLFGAATGGYLFGVLGDRIGRAKAMSCSILCYSLFAAMTWYAQSAQSLLVLRFLTCMGIGGMWPNGIALLSEAWPNVSRPVLAGVMGTSANVGILLFSILTLTKHVTGDDWRWTMLVGATPLLLGIISWVFVPESPRWLAVQQTGDRVDTPKKGAGVGEIFRPPLLRLTLIGIMLGTIPLFGGWGVSNWATAWASETGDKQQKAADGSDDEPKKKADPTLKSRASIARSLPGSITSLLGGAFAFYLGRKRSYFILCLGALICTQFLFRSDPQDDAFLYWMAALGAFSGAFFGWLPLCLPELFPTRVRATGAGVSFNWGRILTGVGVLASAAALKQAFEGRYSDVGLITGFIYAVGMIVILLAPDISNSDLAEEN